MRSLLFVAAPLFCFSSRAQTLRTPVAAFYPSLLTYSAQQKDAFSFRHNAAAPAGVQTFSAGLYSERRFGLTELSAHSLVAVLPTGSGRFGFGGDYRGSAAYNQTELGFGYGRSLGTKADVGARFLYHAARAAGYGSASAVTFDAGAVWHLTDAVQTGISVYNPVRMKLGKGGEERLPSIYSMGIGWDASPQFFIGAEAQKTEGRPLTLTAGFQYRFAERLTARAGYASGTSLYSFGFGVMLKGLRTDVAASFHPYLGLTPGLLLLYSAPK